MPRICEVCGNEEESRSEESQQVILHVCDNCIQDRQPPLMDS
ncbi:hypothetical protein [Brevibacillus humidisoli]|nr:hypothetical protein [Brevibacillus humidisoli]